MINLKKKPFVNLIKKEMPNKDDLIKVTVSLEKKSNTVIMLEKLVNDYGKEYHNGFFYNLLQEQAGK